MKTLLALVLLTGFTLPARALLGESLPELQRRYGRPLEAPAPTVKGTDVYTFIWETYNVAVTLKDGQSASEEFAKRDRRSFTLEEVRSLLAEGADPGVAWVQVTATRWKQRDRVAEWAGQSVRISDSAFGG